MAVMYRKRLIPKECVLLKDDIVMHQDDRKIITKWNTLKPKKNLHHGYSVYYLDEGIKVSKFLREDGSLLYWYCDIISTDYDSTTDTYVFTDLLADVIVYPDGTVRIVDLEEVAEVIKQDEISKEEIASLCISLDKLLKVIYNDDFDSLIKDIKDFT